MREWKYVSLLHSAATHKKTCVAATAQLQEKEEKISRSHSPPPPPTSYFLSFVLSPSSVSRRRRDRFSMPACLSLSTPPPSFVSLHRRLALQTSFLFPQTRKEKSWRCVETE